MKWRGEIGHCERGQQNRVEQMEQVEQNQNVARGCHEEGLGAKGVFQYVFQMFHLFDDEAISAGKLCMLLERQQHPPLESVAAWPFTQACSP